LTGKNLTDDTSKTPSEGNKIGGVVASRNQATIKLTAHRCDGDCQEALEKVDLETFKRRWSEPNDWPSKKVPVEGEDVEILPGWDMIYDLEDGQAPKYRIIHVNGWLTFQNGEGYGDITLKAKHIFVRAG
jgi:hypothetical protein